MKNLSFPELVLLFLPLLLLTGPALPDISIVLIGIYFIFKSFKNQKIIFYNKNFFFIGLTFSFYLIINSVFKGHFWFSVENEGSIFYFRYIFFVAGFVNAAPFRAKSTSAVVPAARVLAAKGFTREL